ncbi:MAG: TIGR04219 family outer membrane beta-barrel protein [Gammaproteobacteria bacterium]|nr:TIGR04219 family outer membrane beta-barrel protein [Gammaproteobacteria bacterium]
MKSTPALLLAICGLTCAFDAAADTVFGLYAGVSSWQQEASGDVTSGDTSADVKDDLGIGDDRNNVMYLALEHPIPMLPNVRVQYLEVALSGANTLSRDIEYNDTTFPVDTFVRSEIDVKQGSALLYYELLDNVVSVDVGVDVRYFDGRSSVVSAVDSADVDFQVVLALPYARARIDVPTTGLWFSAEVSALSYSGDSLVDADLALGWESPIGFGVQAGYRRFQLQFDGFDDVDELDVAIEGPYAGLTFHF